MTVPTSGKVPITTQVEVKKNMFYNLPELPTPEALHTDLPSLLLGEIFPVSGTFLGVL